METDRRHIDRQAVRVRLVRRWLDRFLSLHLFSCASYWFTHNISVFIRFPSPRLLLMQR